MIGKQQLFIIVIIIITAVAANIFSDILVIVWLIFARHLSLVVNFYINGWKIPLRGVHAWESHHKLVRRARTGHKPNFNLETVVIYRVRITLRPPTQMLSFSG